MAKEAFQLSEDEDFNVVNFDVDPDLLANGGKLNGSANNRSNADDDADDDDDEDIEDDDQDDDDQDNRRNQRSHNNSRSSQNKNRQNKSQKNPTLNIDDEEFDELVLKKGLKTASSGEGDENGEDDDEDQETGKDKSKKTTKQGEGIDRNNVILAHGKSMLSNGLWKEIPGKEFDGSEEAYEELREYNRSLDAEDLLDEYVDGAFQKNPEGKALGKKFLKHLANGGRIADFQTAYSPVDIKVEDLEDDDDEKANTTAELLLRDYFTRVGWKKEKIDLRINKMRKTDSLVSEANEYREPWQELVEKTQNSLEEDTRRTSETRKASQKKFFNGLTTLFEKTPAFGGLKVYTDQKDRQAAESYLFAPAAEGSSQSQFNIDLHEALQDPQSVLFLSALLRQGMHKTPDKLLVDKRKAKDDAASDLRKSLEGSLLNKDKDGKQDQSSSGAESRSNKTKFDPDNVVMV